MKKHFTIFLIICGVMIVPSCKIVNNTSKQEYAWDIVCGMKVDKAEAYTYKYKDTKYYFDNYNCKQTFKMNPEKFINNPCEKKIK